MSIHTPVYPQVRVKLSGTDNHVLAIVGTLITGLRGGGIPESEITRITNEALSGNYENIFATCFKYVRVG